MSTSTNPTLVTTGKVRLSYANLFKPKAASPGAKEKYSVSIIIDKEDKETVQKIEAAIKAAIVAGMSKLDIKDANKLPKNFKTPLRDGDEERGDDPAYVGKWFLNCSSDNKPKVINREKEEITDPTQVISGDYARVNINLYAFNTSGNKGIAAGLNAVQKIKNGEPLGSTVNVDAVFDDLGDDDLEEDDL